MGEAERLCDRAALINRGRVRAIDDAAGLIARIGAQQRIRFHPSRPVNDQLLTALPEVSHITNTGDAVVVTGSGDVLGVVTFALAREGIVAQRLDVQQASLEDAFVALTREPA